MFHVLRRLQKLTAGDFYFEQPARTVLVQVNACGIIE